MTGESERDLMKEAEQWRSQVRHPILANDIADLGGEELKAAYLAWWTAYTSSVRRAPSNRMGISSTDAAEAGETANRAVREMLVAVEARS